MHVSFGAKRDIITVCFVVRCEDYFDVSREILDFEEKINEKIKDVEK